MIGKKKPIRNNRLRKLFLTLSKNENCTVFRQSDSFQGGITNCYGLRVASCNLNKKETMEEGKNGRAEERNGGKVEGWKAESKVKDEERIYKKPTGSVNGWVFLKPICDSVLNLTHKRYGYPDCTHR